MPHMDTAQLERMLAEHEERHGERVDELLTGHPPDSGYRAEDWAPGGRYAITPPAEPEQEPPTDWPIQPRHWTPKLIAERRRWVRKLYGDQGLTREVTADRLKVSKGTVGADVRAMGIGRGSASPGKGGVRSVRADARREAVRRLYVDEGKAPVDIAEQLSVHPTTIYYDLSALDILREDTRKTDRTVAGQIERAVSQLDDLAQFLLNHETLDQLLVEPKQAQAWEKSLKRVVRAVSRVRKTMKGS